MKVLYVAPRYFPAMGGAETHVKEVSERLACRGHDVTVLTTHERGEPTLPASEVINGVTVVRFASPHRCERLFNVALTVRGVHRLLGWVIGLDKRTGCWRSVRKRSRDSATDCGNPMW